MALARMCTDDTSENVPSTTSKPSSGLCFCSPQGIWGKKDQWEEGKEEEGGARKEIEGEESKGREERREGEKEGEGEEREGRGRQHKMAL